MNSLSATFSYYFIMTNKSPLYTGTPTTPSSSWRRWRRIRRRRCANSSPCVQSINASPPSEPGRISSPGTRPTCPSPTSSAPSATLSWPSSTWRPRIRKRILKTFPRLRLLHQEQFMPGQLLCLFWQSLGCENVKVILSLEALLTFSWPWLCSCHTLFIMFI